MDEETKELLEQVQNGGVYAVMWYDSKKEDYHYEIFDSGRYANGMRDAENFAKSLLPDIHHRIWIGRITGVLNP